MVSIDDVAAAAGVSPTTVSHTLSGKRIVSPHLQQRVRAAMEELGYSPRRAARNLATGRTRLIALIVPDIANAFFAELARGIEGAAIDAGYNMVLCTTGFNHERELLYLETLRSRAVDGIVYAAGAPPTNSELAKLLGDMPLVLVDEDIPGATAPAFVSDNAEGGRLAARHLLSHGHRSAVVFTADRLESARQRVDGFVDVWTSAGGSVPVVRDGGFSYEGGREALCDELARFRRGDATCVFATNDLMALGAIDELEQAGLQVPGDVSVVGFDDTIAARYTRPQLTSVRQDVALLGSSAAAALIRFLDSEEPLASTRAVIPVEFVERASTGPSRN